MTDEELLEDLDKITLQIKSIKNSILKDLTDHTAIKNMIIDYFDIDEEIFQSKVRKRDDNVFPRFFYYLFTKAILNLSLHRIGVNGGNKDHATVLHGIKTICRLLSVNDRDVTEHYNNLLIMLKDRGFSVKKVIDFVRENCK